MTARPIAAIVLPPLLAFGFGYWVAPKDQLDEEAEHTGFFRVDTTKVLSATIESLREENRLLVYSYKGSAKVRVKRRWLWILTGSQELQVPAVVNYYLDLAGLTLANVAYEEKARLVRVKLPKLQMRSQIVLGGDPAAEKAQRKAVITFKELGRLHVEHAQAHLRSHATVEMSYRVQLLPRFGKMRIDEITPQAIEKFFAELRQRLAPASVDRLRLVMHRGYHLAQTWVLPGSQANPVARVTRPRYDNKRTCLLDSGQVKALLEACAQSENPILLPFATIALATAARKREILNARIEHIDLDRAEWLIPVTKNGKPRRVPLSAPALEVIRKLPRHDDCPWLLPNPKTLKPYDNLKRSWRSATRLCGMPGLRIHDLRHAAIGAMINNGVDLYVAGRVAGHLRPDSTARYSSLADKTLAAAVEAGASHLKL